MKNKQKIAVSPFEFAIMVHENPKAKETHREFTAQEIIENREAAFNNFFSKIKTNAPNKIPTPQAKAKTQRR